jgi:glycerophosphoryl diester phosphodiesterase
MRKLVLAGLLTASFLVVSPGPASAATTCADLEIMAHRGYHSAPGIAENTLEAFDGAAARGYSIETDVWSDAEGKLWIFHDRDVYRATGTHGYIDQMTSAQVAALRYKKGGDPLPTFLEAVNAWQYYASTQRIYIEPKRQSYVDKMVPILRQYSVVNNVYFTGSTSYAENNYPEFGSAPKSIETYRDPSYWTQRGADAVLSKWQGMSSSQVDAYHQAGLEVEHRTANSTGDWSQAITLGFDSIMTDFPDKLKAFCPSV